MSQKSGLLVNIYRNATHGDCTNGGQSSKQTSGIITGKNVVELFEPSDAHPEYVIIEDECAGSKRIRAIPADLVDTGIWTMFGGNFLWSSDSRFPHDAPIKIHDRVET